MSVFILPEDYESIRKYLIAYLGSKEIEKKIASIYTTYTKHDLRHFQEVEKLSVKISEKVNLTDKEKLCLSLACYCHDIGMSEYQKDLDKEYLSSVDEMRRLHADHSCEIVHRDLIDVIRDEDVRMIVGSLCSAHSLHNLDHVNAIDYDVRTQLLSAILQFADSLDLRNERKANINSNSIDELLKNPLFRDGMGKKGNNDSSELSCLHWLRHYYSTPPSLEWRTGNVPRLTVTLSARVGEVKSSNYTLKRGNKTIHLDPRLAIIEEIITTDVRNTLEEINKIFETYFIVNFQKSNLENLDYLQVHSSREKWLFPLELVLTALENCMVFPRNVPLSSAEAYKKRRIEPYLYYDGLLLSYSSRAATLNPPDIVKKKVGTHYTHVTELQNLSTWHWDIVLLATAKFAQKVISIYHSDQHEGFLFIDYLSKIPFDIFSGKMLKMYLIYNETPLPYTANGYVSKHATYSSNGKLSGGQLSICNSDSICHFEALFENIARRLQIDSNPCKVEHLKPLCNPVVAGFKTTDTIIDIYNKILNFRDLHNFSNEFIDCINKNICKLNEIKKNKIDLLKTILKVEQMNSSFESEIADIEKSHFVYPWTEFSKFETYIKSGDAYIVSCNCFFCGYFLVKPVDTKLVIVKMAVKFILQRYGIGSYIIEFITEYAKKRGLESIMLHVRESNTSAISFYKSQKFTTIDIKKQYYSKSTYEDALEMGFML